MMFLSFLKKLLLLLFISTLSTVAYSQKKLAPLPDKIDESSALLCIGDSVFITLNDSGNNPELYVVNKKGEIINTSVIENAKNIDWEALATDGRDRLFIGDIGNNKNNRTDLCIYIVSLQQVLNDTSTWAEQLTFSYPDQEEFPPDVEELYYDAEAMIYRNDSLFIFTKNRTVPFDGKSKVYGLSLTQQHQVAVSYLPIYLEKTNWLEDSVTDACLTDNTLFLLTYSKIYIFSVENNKYIKKDVVELKRSTQVEGICYANGKLYLSDEKSILGKQFLYELEYSK